MSTNRLFIGIPIPFEIGLEIQDALPDFPFLTRTDLTNYHITLLFLGPVPNLQEVIKKFESQNFSSFTISVTGIGGFYKKDKLSVLYATIGQGHDHLADLSKKTASMFPEYADNLFPSFTPHVTLCRNIKKEEILEAEGLLNFQFNTPITFEAFKLTLFDSSSKMSGLYKHVHSIRAEWDQ